MATTYTHKKLAFIQLADSKGDIYDSGTTTGLVHNIVLYNGNTTTETITIYLHDGTHEYALLQVDLDKNETLIIPFGNEGVVVDSSSKLTGFCDTASYVTCLVCGTEETTA